MALSEQERRELRRRVEKELKAEKLRVRAVFFVVSFIMYVVFMLMSWGIFLSNGGAAPIPGVEDSPLVGSMIMLSVAGFMGLLFQFIALMMETKAGEREMRERLASQVLNSAMLRLGYEDEDLLEETPREKAKRIMRLTDDGELEAVAAPDLIEEDAPPARRQRG
ncbi:MAG: hypothetical protein MUE40_10565 [Anaerolineae bacterium]|jgi:hypothetical protein|nr:hypothetical protein [Anaerolineae bacterium]